MQGQLEVLNVAKGDMKFSFNGDDPMETARAERVVVDMLRRGYLLFVESEGETHRVTRFDASTHEYIIADGADPHAKDSEPQAKDSEVTKTRRCKEKKNSTAKKKTSTRRVKAAKSKATAVAPTAGG